MIPKEHWRYIRELAQRDGRYAPEAYLFVSEAVARTAEWVMRGILPPDDVGPSRGEGSEFHVSGRELLAGIRKLAKERWGCLAPYVFRAWGITRCEDFGEIVFNMVEDETLQWKKRECDRREDFAGGYDFNEAFSSFEL